MSSFSRCVALAFVASVALACGSSSSSGDAKPAGTPGTFQQASAKASLGQSVGQIQSIKKGGSDAQSGSLSLLAGANAYSGFVTPGGTGAPASAPSGKVMEALGTCDCKGTTCTFKDCGDDPNSKLNGTTTVTADHVVLDLSLVTSASGNTVTIAMKCDLTVPSDAVTGTCTTNGDIKTNAGGMAVDVTFATSATYALKLSNGSPSGGSIDVASSTNYGGMEYTAGSKISFPLTLLCPLFRHPGMNPRAATARRGNEARSPQAGSRATVLLLARWSRSSPNRVSWVSEDRHVRIVGERDGQVRLLVAIVDAPPRRQCR